MFNLVDRKQKRYMALISGWAFDYRIFHTLDLPYNYIFFNGDSNTNFGKELVNFLKINDIDKISLLGWSQGAFKACNFATEYPEITEDIILVGLKRKYEKNALENIKGYLVKNRISYLYSFYKKCFCRQERIYYQWFKDTLFKTYLKEMSLDKLISGLDWLAEAEIDMKILKKLKHIKIIHGSADSIAPFTEAVELADNLPDSQLIIFENTGHLPFLHQNFKRCLYEC